MTKLQALPELDRHDLHVLEVALTELSARQQVDRLDAEWEQQMARHVSRGGRRGRLYVDKGADWAVGMVGGGCVIAYSLFMLVQFIVSPKGALIPMAFFCFLLAAGLFVIGASLRARKKHSRYQIERARYIAARKLLVGQLPPEFQRPLRFCPNCLNQDPD